MYTSWNTVKSHLRAPKWIDFFPGVHSLSLGSFFVLGAQMLESGVFSVLRVQVSNGRARPLCWLPISSPLCLLYGSHHSISAQSLAGKKPCLCFLICRLYTVTFPESVLYIPDHVLFFITKFYNDSFYSSIRKCIKIKIYLYIVLNRKTIC